MEKVGWGKKGGSSEVLEAFIAEVMDVQVVFKQP